MGPIFRAETNQAMPNPSGAAPAGTAPAGAAPNIIAPWVELLGATIENEILPRLLSAHRDETGLTPDHPINEAEVAAFVRIIVADDIEQARAVADRVIVHYGGRDALLKNLLTPAARLLGKMWEQDTADFMTVTLGVYRLDQILKETATAGFAAPLSAADNRILLLPAPGEQHSFGLAMVADTFREGGWCVRSGPAATKTQLLRLVKDEWFDIVGLSISAERAMKGLPATIRALRLASCNPGVHILLGGRAVTENKERARFLGADATAPDAAGALAHANFFLESTVTERVTERLHRSKTRLVDIG
jgi:methanogenic corrinoid protein MtbC1